MKKNEIIGVIPIGSSFSNSIIKEKMFARGTKKQQKMILTTVNCKAFKYAYNNPLNYNQKGKNIRFYFRLKSGIDLGIVITPKGYFKFIK